MQDPRYRILIPEFIQDWYVGTFCKCRKCGKEIDTKKGYWHWDDVYPQIGGYYHTNCGTILSPADVEFKKELDRLF